MLKLLRRRRHRDQAHAPTPDRADLQIRNLLDDPRLQAVMGENVDGNDSEQIHERAAA